MQAVLRHMRSDDAAWMHAVAENVGDEHAWSTGCRILLMLFLLLLLFLSVS